MYCNSILIFSYCAVITPFEGIELDTKQTKKKDDTGCDKAFSGKRHGHIITTTIRE